MQLNAHTSRRGAGIPNSATAEIHALGVPKHRSTHTHSQIGNNLNDGLGTKIGRHRASVRDTANNHGPSRRESTFHEILRSGERYHLWSEDREDGEDAIQAAEINITLSLVHSRLQGLNVTPLLTNRTCEVLKAKKIPKKQMLRMMIWGM